MEKKTAEQILNHYIKTVKNGLEERQMVDAHNALKAMQTFVDQESEPLNGKIKELEEEYDTLEEESNNKGLRIIDLDNRIESLQKQLEEQAGAYSEIGNNYSHLLVDFTRLRDAVKIVFNNIWNEDKSYDGMAEVETLLSSIK